MWFLLLKVDGTSVEVGTSVVALAITGVGRGVVMEIEAGQVYGESVVKSLFEICSTGIEASTIDENAEECKWYLYDHVVG